jgi:hypothetical protein
MKKTFRQFEHGTADFVVHHGRHMASRGKNPSMPYMGLKNPQQALVVATYTLNGYCYGKTPYDKHLYVVIPGGWMIQPNCNTRLCEALSKAAEGKDPGLYDNSKFYRVGSAHEHKILALYYHDWTLDILCGKPVTSAYLSNGKQVEVKS